jgi:hypothetical protein
VCKILGKENAPESTCRYSYIQSKKVTVCSIASSIGTEPMDQSLGLLKGAIGF